MNAAQRRKFKRAVARLKGKPVLVKNWQTKGQWMPGVLERREFPDSGCAVIRMDERGKRNGRLAVVHMKRVRPGSAGTHGVTTSVSNTNSSPPTHDS